MPAHLLDFKMFQQHLHSEKTTHYKMPTLLFFFLFPALLSGGAPQANITMEDGETPLIKEDDESFQMQDQLFGYKHCNETFLQRLSGECQQMFADFINDTHKELLCDWPSVIRQYNLLTVCMESITSHLSCFYPNPVVNEAFLQVHRLYFLHCDEQEEGFSDAPHYVVVALTLVPVCLLPVLVLMVVWKNNAKE
ncbi:hypothetical protein GJAV_G00150790 [Gymnothorax javanicus]|nr:hypothetical protein GJAV_G00150790 [Gymnothorax javanicus]